MKAGDRWRALMLPLMAGWPRAGRLSELDRIQNPGILNGQKFGVPGRLRGREGDMYLNLTFFGREKDLEDEIIDPMSFRSF